MTFDELEELHYITPLVNVKSIVQRGILSHQKAEKIAHESVAMDEIQERRKKVVVPGGRPLHQYVNLYFHARNPMMFKRKEAHLKLSIIRVTKDVLSLPKVVIADRNASSDYVLFTSSPDGLRFISKSLVYAKYWNHEDPIEKFRHASIKCAEVLVPDKIPTDFILGAYVSCEESKIKLYDIIKEIDSDFLIDVNQDLFFQ